MAAAAHEGVLDEVLQLKEKANKLYVSKSFEEAAALYTTAIEQCHVDSAAAADFVRIVKCNRAACLIELGTSLSTQYDRAIEDLHQVLESFLTPDPLKSSTIEQKAHYRLARCFFELGRYDDAIKALDAYRAIVGGLPGVQEAELRSKVLRCQGIDGREESGSENRNMRRNGEKDKAKEREPRTGSGTSNASKNTAEPVPLRYEVKVAGLSEPIVIYDYVPLTLCSSHPPEMPTKIFMAQLMKRYHDNIMAHPPSPSRVGDGSPGWKCWNCDLKAVSMVHTPASYLHLYERGQEPMVVDFAQPVCVNGGKCEREARKMMEEEMRLAAAMGKMPLF